MINTDTIYIQGNVPSSKNSKIKTKNGIFNSKTTQKYLTSLGIKTYSTSKKYVSLYKRRPLIFPYKSLKQATINLKYPYFIGLHFIRSTKHRFDFNNVSQIILDLFTAFDIIEDDSMNYIILFPLYLHENWFSYNKENAGVIVTFNKMLILKKLNQSIHKK